ncbi:MAG: SDR family NAD(P)-dependent oxidoreductase [Candidatus Dormibacteraceae bacterium]
MELFSLEGRVAVVTGGNGGIGLAMASAMVDAGATVVLASRNRAKAEAALAGLGAGRGRSGFLEVDVADKAQCQRLVERTVADLGRLDIPINNAGVSVRKMPQDVSLEEWHRVVDTNLGGTLYCSQAAYAPMRAQGGGKIVNIASVLSSFGTWYSAAYGSSKGGVVQLTKALGVAWAPDNIQVNAVVPGWIDTELTVAARASVPGLRQRVEQRTPAGRWGLPSDLGGVAVFLASRASDFVTASTITVDGGYTALG